MKPNKSESKQLALLVTDKDIIQLFIDTLAKHKDWKATSVVNIGMTKGAAFNILKHARTYANGQLNMGVVHAIREFGEYLPAEILAKVPKKKRVKRGTDVVPFHNEPTLD